MEAFEYAYGQLGTRFRGYVDYVNNINEAEFDGLFLHREYFGRSYDYDDKGNVARDGSNYYGVLNKDSI